MSKVQFSENFIRKRVNERLHELKHIRVKRDYPTLRVDPQDLFSYNQDSFIYQIYLTVLGREPDKKGLNANLKMLNSGVPKSYILYKVLKSNEARNNKNKIVFTNQWKLIIKYYVYKIIVLFKKIS
jgi:hypothetical protein